MVEEVGRMLSIFADYESNEHKDFFFIFNCYEQELRASVCRASRAVVYQVQGLYRY